MTTVGSVNGLIQPQQARTAAVKKGAVKPAVSAATPSVTKGASEPLRYIYGGRIDGYEFEKIYGASFADVTHANAWTLGYSKVDAIKMPRAKKQEILQQIWKNFGFKDDMPKSVKKFGELRALINKRLGMLCAHGANQNLIDAKYLVELNKRGLISDDAFKKAFFYNRALSGAALASKKQKYISIAEGMARDFDGQHYTSPEFLRRVRPEQLELERNKKIYAARVASQLAVDEATAPLQSQIKELEAQNATLKSTLESAQKAAGKSSNAAEGAVKPVVTAAADAAEGAAKSVASTVADAAGDAAEGAAKSVASTVAGTAGDAAGTAAKAAEKAAKGLGKWGWGAIIVAGLAVGGFIATKIFGKKEPETQSGLNQQA